MIMIVKGMILTHYWCDACIVYIDIAKQMRFLNNAFFLAKVMFRYHFLGNFWAELNEIGCGSLFNSTLKTF